MLETLGLVGLAIVVFLFGVVILFGICLLWKFIRPILWILGVLVLIILVLGLIFNPQGFATFGYFGLAAICLLAAWAMFKIIKALL